jgi:type IV pilus assembly protein PilM
LTSTAPTASLESQFFKLGLVRKLERWLYAMPHTPIVVEVAPQRVSAVRWGAKQGTVDGVATVALPSGAIMASPVDTNITQPDAVKQAVREVCDRVQGRGVPMALLVPDPVVRVFILPFDNLPRRAEDALPLLRWRLKKSVPFDMDETVLSWSRQNGREGNLEIVTAVARQRIIREYEDLIAGVEGKPEVVLSSTLCTLPLLEDRGATLLVRMCGKTMTTAVARGATLSVYRATEMPMDVMALDPQITLDEVFPAIAYYQDTYGSPIDRARIAGFGVREADFQAALEVELKVPVARLGDSETARGLESSARDLIHQDLDATVGWMLNEES